MRDVIEVSYTGDLLAHRRCPRSWAYQKHAGLRPYEQVQAMEGRLIHHAMEWMTAFFKQQHRHSTESECRTQLERYFRVLWARGIRTRFESKANTLERVLGNLFPGHYMHPTAKAAIEGAVHSEYEIRAIRQLVPARTGGKSRLLLTGILDLVVQQQQPLKYHSTWKWTDASRLEGKVTPTLTIAATGDEEIWDYKGTRASTTYLADYASC
ncbi:PD-(D/E)XK nuclease family protein [Archangium gephyra]|uniref:PD-(D/E)XK nuclease family protein n=1 Tax=Archangium gephyra TaxID=48 RepID=UPI00094B1815